MPVDLEAWGTEAKRLLTEALERMDDEDVLILLSAAEVCLRICYGEVDPSEYPLNSECICPPDLAARGGFISACRAHER